MRGYLTLATCTHLEITNGARCIWGLRPGVRGNPRGRDARMHARVHWDTRDTQVTRVSLGGGSCHWVPGLGAVSRGHLV